jgi:hypothetical protein
MNPFSKGLRPATITIGIVDVACFAALITGLDRTRRSTSTFIRTESPASGSRRLELPSAYRLSTTMFLPSIQPRLRKPSPNSG